MREPARRVGLAAANAWLAGSLRRMGNAALALSDRLSGTVAQASAPAGPPAHWLALVTAHAPTLLRKPPALPAAMISTQHALPRGPAAPPATATATTTATKQPAASTVSSPRSHTAPDGASSVPGQRPQSAARPTAGPAAVVSSASSGAPPAWPIQKPGLTPARHRASALRFRRAPVSSSPPTAAALGPAGIATNRVPAQAARVAPQVQVQAPAQPQAQAWDTPRPQSHEAPAPRRTASPRWPALPGDEPASTSPDPGPWPALPEAWGAEAAYRTDQSPHRTSAAPWSG